MDYKTVQKRCLGDTDLTNVLCSILGIKEVSELNHSPKFLELKLKYFPNDQFIYEDGKAKTDILVLMNLSAETFDDKFFVLNGHYYLLPHGLQLEILQDLIKKASNFSEKFIVCLICGSLRYSTLLHEIVNKLADDLTAIGTFEDWLTVHFIIREDPDLNFLKETTIMAMTKLLQSEIDKK